MDPCLKVMKRDLSDNRVQHILDFAGDHDLAQRRVVGLCQKPLEGQHFTENTGRLRHG